MLAICCLIYLLSVYIIFMSLPYHLMKSKRYSINGLLFNFIVFLIVLFYPLWIFIALIEVILKRIEKWF